MTKAKSKQPDAPAPKPISKVVDTPHAPIIHFDGAPNCGVRDGIINVTLAVQCLTPNAGAIDVNVVVAAYLRCSIIAARDLRDALDKALLIASAQAEGHVN